MSGFFRRRGWRRVLVIFTLGAAVLWLVLAVQPFSDGPRKLVLLGALGGVWLGPLLLLWPYPRGRGMVLSLGALPVALLLLPGRPIDGDRLRADYLERLRQFEGTRYVWGGEGRHGVDCSGLPRRALREALVWQGLRRLNGRALREAAEHWWFDASAKALGEGHRGYTHPVGVAGTARRIDPGRIEPGDLAVTDGGLHVLVHLGDGRWIQADPGAGMVIISGAPGDTNTWLDEPATVHRWAVFRACGPGG